ncbi:UDP-glucuronic acid decarboxylase family protein [Zoogloea sp.]|uniref:UDP-glucuronic acid decarboxylase family protein n=1 Tax=Zoogloea sp. TaxID=49181 RepID=UPI001416C6A2|nr:MAG: SDR family oxidoreductase [Zoogloea sp.]
MSAQAAQAGSRIVVTGGAGFLGSHLCERLLGMGHHVLCIDNLHTGSRSNIAPFLSHPRYRFLEHDVVHPLVLAEPVDEIYNLACPASPVHYRSDPVGTLKTSVLGALHALDLARAHDARILQASTSEVYGDPEVHPQPESYPGNVNPTGPRACYNEGKRCAETLFFDYHREYGVDIRVARLFNTYGPRMLPEDGRVISSFIVQALRGESLGLFGDGLQTRSFCYVDDMIEGLIGLMAAPAGAEGPVNLGNPREFTILELARRVLALTGAASELVFNPLPGDDPRLRQPDIRLARRLLDWQPVVELDEGLERTVAWFERRLGLARPQRATTI